MQQLTRDLALTKPSHPRCLYPLRVLARLAPSHQPKLSKGIPAIASATAAGPAISTTGGLSSDGDVAAAGHADGPRHEPVGQGSSSDAAGQQVESRLLRATVRQAAGFSGRVDNGDGGNDGSSRGGGDDDGGGASGRDGGSSSGGGDDGGSASGGDGGSSGGGGESQPGAGGSDGPSPPRYPLWLRLWLIACGAVYLLMLRPRLFSERAEKRRQHDRDVADYQKYEDDWDRLVATYTAREAGAEAAATQPDDASGGGGGRAKGSGNGNGGARDKSGSGGSGAQKGGGGCTAR